MADVSINELPVATEMSDDALTVVYQNLETKSITGALIKQYAKDSVKSYAEEAAALATADAKAANEAAQQAQKNAETAEQNAETAETNAKNAQTAAETAETNAAGSATASEAAASNAEQSAQDAEAAKEAIENMEVSVETLSPGANATVVKSIVDGIVKLLIGIPQGLTGATGQTGEKGDTGAYIASIIRTSGTGAAGTTDTYTITLSDGQTFTFNVYNGKDGEGSGDMSKSIYDAENRNTDIFKYVDEQMKNVDFDVTADEVTFSDGETFQQKYDSGELTGPAGADGSPGADGEDGVGIQSVEQTTTSTADGGTNVITVTKTDGSSSTFSVKNGSKGSQGEKGESGSATQYTGTLLAAGWAADANGYQAQTITINGLLASYAITPDIDVVLSGTDIDADNELLAAFGLISIAGTAADSLVAKCTGDAPTVNVPIVLRVWE